MACNVGTSVVVAAVCLHNPWVMCLSCCNLTLSRAEAYHAVKHEAGALVYIES